MTDRPAPRIIPEESITHLKPGKAIKVLVVGQLPPPVHGSTVMAERFMSALRNNGFEPRIVQKTFSRKMDEVGKVSLSKILRVPVHCAELVTAIRRFHPNICIFFISVGFTAFAVDAMLIQLLAMHRIPYVPYFHGTGYSNYRRNGSALQKKIVQKMLSRAHGGIILGERLKADVNFYIPNDRLYVLPNGVPDVDATLERSHRNDGKVHILFLSNLVKTKGPMEFLKMAKSVLEKTGNVRFVMVGRIVDEKFYQDLTLFRDMEGLTKDVEILGPMYDREKEALLSSTDILVFPTYKDTFPLVNLEAMQWGIPVISSNEGAIPDIIRDGVNGYIVDPHNIDQLASRVLELVRDPALRIRMGKSGRELYEKNYSIEAYEKNVGEAINFFACVRSTTPSMFPMHS